MKIKVLILRLLGFKKCPGCHRYSRDVKRRGLNTMYIDDSRNWQTSCYACYEETCDYYQDLWDTYYNAIS
jgi:hypothetical protein